MTRNPMNRDGCYHVTEPSKADPDGLLGAPLLAARCGEAVILAIREHASNPAAAIEDPVSREVVGLCADLAERSEEELRKLLLEPVRASA